MRKGIPRCAWNRLRDLIHPPSAFADAVGQNTVMGVTAGLSDNRAPFRHPIWKRRDALG
ncbi:MAG: hypothetical protein GXP25_22485 [Planctomycetes bacterium]|nr:hypothetical protein [Planctomycetota bacterium]